MTCAAHPADPLACRDTALLIRQTKVTRHIPLVFVAGDADKVAGVRTVLPDAAYATWERIAVALRQSIARPPERPLVPGVFAAYAGVPVARKLGIRENTVVALIGAPSGFEQALGRLPAGAVLRRGSDGSRHLTLWFPRSRKHLEVGVRAMVPHAANGGLWICSVGPRRGRVAAVGLELQYCDLRGMSSLTSSSCVLLLLVAFEDTGGSTDLPEP